LICLASIVNFAQAFLARASTAEAFVCWGPFKLVLTVLIPALFYVLAVNYIGLYVASAIYIAIFMAWLGKYSWLKSVTVALAVNVSLFLMFEVWFKVPLFKGELDPLSFLGY
jgi:hypothetical protein